MTMFDTLNTIAADAKRAQELAEQKERQHKWKEANGFCPPETEEQKFQRRMEETMAASGQVVGERVALTMKDLVLPDRKRFLGLV